METIRRLTQIRKVGRAVPQRMLSKMKCKKIATLCKRTTRKLTPSSRAEDVLKASPEERKRWVEDMIARSNEIVAEELRNNKEKELSNKICEEAIGA